MPFAQSAKISSYAKRVVSASFFFEKVIVVKVYEEREM